MNAPPPAWLESPSVAEWMAFGSFCWDNGCVDMVPPDQMPDVPGVEVAADDEVTVHLPFDPSEVTLRLAGQDEHVSLPSGRQVSWTVSGFGFVVVTAWRGTGGDASYVVELVEESAP